MPLLEEFKDQYNADVAAWAKRTKEKLLFRLASLDLETKVELLQRQRDGRKPLSQSMRTYIKKEFNQAEIVRFSFWVHGYFYDRGVGKGAPLSRARQTRRVAKPWIDFILEDQVETLADIIVEIYGDDVVENLKIRR